MTLLAQTLEQVMSQWAMSNTPTIKPNLYRGSGRKWTICLIEIWPDDGAQFIGSSYLDKQVYWTETILSSWHGARRTAWDTWVFDSKRTAEKFITLHTLQWA